MAQYDLLAAGPDSSHGFLLGACPPRSVVLDVGCGGGHLAKALTKKGCEVWGVDKDPEAVEAARPFCREVRCLDLDQDDLAGAVGRGRFDFVVMADVLEHLRDPARLLIQARSVLKEGGSVGVCVPNVAHWSVRLELLQGSFRRAAFGILDRSHLHHFTPESLGELLEECGYRMEPLGEVVAPVDLQAISRVAEELGAGQEKLRDFLEGSGACAYQLVVRARPQAGPEYVEELLADRIRSRRQKEMLEEKVGLYAEALGKSLERPHPLLRLYGGFRRSLLRLSSSRPSGK